MAAFCIAKNIFHIFVLKGDAMRKILFFICFIIFIQTPALAKELPTEGRIPHAGGSVNGIDHTNSKEAILFLIENKEKVTELDFMFTKDHVLVLNHGWTDCQRKAPTWDQFKSRPIFDQFTPISAKEALSLLYHSQANIQIMVDTQEKDIIAVYKELKRICDEMDPKYFKKVIIPAFYYEKEYKTLDKLFHFKYYAFYSYKQTGKKKTKPKVSFDKFERIFKKCPKTKYISMWSFYCTKKNLNKVHLYCDNIIAHSVNSIKQQHKLQDLGVQYYMTDIL